MPACRCRNGPAGSPIFVPAWDEAAVIGAMLAHARAAFGAADYLLYVGCYPNDPATIAAVRAAAGGRVRLVIGPAPGPTSKADCLNRLWERMIEDEAAEGMRFKAVVLHDAEDVVHSAELGLFDALIERFDLVQLPVVPLIDPARDSSAAIISTSSPRRTARSWSSARRSAPACPRPGRLRDLAATRSPRWRRSGARRSTPKA